LIIDEAQNLPDRTLEEIRMLSNLEAEKEHLVQIILVGQPELRQKLRRPHLRQFLQRITVHYHLEGLKDQDELREYIRHRLHVAGCPTYATLFTDQAISAVWAESQGIPRLINYICDMALVHGYADGLTTIDEETINEVIEARSESSLFGGEEPDLKEYEDQVAQNSSENSHVQNEALETLGSRVSFLESMVEAQATQLQELSSDRTTRDQLTLEIFHLLQKDVEKRWALNNRYQLLLAELKQLKRSQKFNGQMMVAPGEPETEVEIQKKKSLFKKIFS
ncbi:AAA family ATPase, partial [bacterium]|nr:AAA family ATPase [bacterium]